MQAYSKRKRDDTMLWRQRLQAKQAATCGTPAASSAPKANVHSQHGGKALAGKDGMLSRSVAQASKHPLQPPSRNAVRAQQHIGKRRGEAAQAQQGKKPKKRARGSTHVVRNSNICDSS